MLTCDSVRRVESWQVVVIAAVAGYLALGVATGTVRIYHWFMLAIIPLVVFARESTRDFLIDWAPMVAFWLVYDRLRLIQRFVLDRVAVAWP